MKRTFYETALRTFTVIALGTATVATVAQALHGPHMMIAAFKASPPCTAGQGVYGVHVTVMLVIIGVACAWAAARCERKP